MLAKFEMTGCKRIGTPLDVNLKLRQEEEDILKDSTMYRGSLNYLTLTRSDIAYAVSVLSQFTQEPKKPDFDVARQILRYVKNTVGLGILGRKDVDFRFNGYTDADWAGNSYSRRSATGYCFRLESGFVSWSRVARSNRKSHCPIPNVPPLHELLYL